MEQHSTSELSGAEAHLREARGFGNHGTALHLYQSHATFPAKKRTDASHLIRLVPTELLFGRNEFCLFLIVTSLVT